MSVIDVQSHYQDLCDVESKLDDFRYALSKIDINLDGYLKGRVLDAGCGKGYLPMHLQNMGIDCYGIDSDPRAIDIAKGMVKYPEKLVRGDIGNPPFEEQFFDLVLSTALLAHIEDFWFSQKPNRSDLIKKEKESMVRGIYHITKRGGLYLLHDNLLIPEETSLGGFEILFKEEFWGKSGYMGLRKPRK